MRVAKMANTRFVPGKGLQVRVIIRDPALRPIVARIRAELDRRCNGKPAKVVEALAEFVPKGSATEQAAVAARINGKFQEWIELARAELRGEAEAAQRYYYCDPTGGGFSGARIVKWNPARVFPESAAAVVTVDTVIALWEKEREAEKRKPKDRAVENKRSKMRRLFDFLGHSDMAKIGESDLKRYRVKLLAEGIARDHLIDIKALFAVAHRGGFLTSDPAAAIEYPAKAFTPRQPFTAEEQRAILAAAALSDNPVIRWGNWLASFSGAITEEIIGVRTTDVYELDGVPVLHIRPPEGENLKTEYRPRIVPLPSRGRAEFLAYVASLPAGPIFPGINSTQASAKLMKFIRGLGVADKDKVFYSWRHTVCSALENVPGVSRDLARHLVGHAPVDIHARHYLHPPIADMAKAIEGLSCYGG